MALGRPGEDVLARVQPPPADLAHGLSAIEILAALAQLCGALGDTLFQRLVNFLERFFSLLALGYVNAHLENEPRAVGIYEREIEYIVGSPIRPGPLPTMRRVGFQNGVRLAAFARLVVIKQEFVAFPVQRMAEPFAEYPVGKCYPVVWRHQTDVSRQRLEHVVEPLPFSPGQLGRLIQLCGPLRNALFQLVMRLLQRRLGILLR